MLVVEIMRKLITPIRPKRLLLLLVSLFSLLVAQALPAQELGLLSVDSSRAPRYVGRVAEELILRESARYGGTEAVSSEVVSERFLTAGGDPALLKSCSDPVCAAAIARTAGLDAVILAEIAADGSAYGLVLRVIGADGETDLTAEELIFDLRDLDDGIARAAEGIALAAGIITLPEAVAESPEIDASEPDPQPEAEPESEPEPEAEQEIVREAPPEGIIGGSVLPEVGSYTETSSSRFLAWNSGLALLQLAGLGNMITLYIDNEASTSYYLYLGENDQTKIDRFYGEYEDYHLAARVSAVSTYALNLAAPVSAGIALFSGDPEELALSRRGRHYLYAGLFSSIAGNFVYLSGIDSLVHRSYLKAKYENDTVGEEYYEEQYRSLQGEVLTTQAAAIALWGLGSAAFLTAPNQPGPRTPIASGFWDKLFISTGIGLLSGGNVMASLAGFSRTEAEAAWYEYLQAEDEISKKYAQMEEEYDQYYLYSGLAAGFWAGGALMIAAAELFDLPDPFPDRKRTAARDGGVDPLTKLRFQPTADGGALYVHLEL